MSDTPEPNDNSETQQPTPNATNDEAEAKLEDHLCAICDEVLIDACRISCGHVFCRHCLNLNKNLNERGKPTCFICDAAITEMHRLSDRDQEIDRLYSSLPTHIRLSRARAKTVRKSEQDNPRPAPEPSQENGNGDTEEAGACAAPLQSDANEWDALFQAAQPILYGHSSAWPGRNLEVSLDEEESPYASLTTPIVIHHTVQHVYHSLDVHSEETDGDAWVEYPARNSFRWPSHSQNSSSNPFNSPLYYQCSPSSCSNSSPSYYFPRPSRTPGNFSFYASEHQYPEDYQPQPSHQSNQYVFVHDDTDDDDHHHCHCECSCNDQSDYDDNEITLNVTLPLPLIPDNITIIAASGGVDTEEDDSRPCTCNEFVYLDDD